MSQSTRSLLKEWSSELKQYGFKVKGSLLAREIEALEHSITLQRSRTAAPGRIRINLYVSVRDKFLEPPESVVCLAGHVSKTRAGFLEQESWWAEDELIEQGLSALKDFGFEWFGKFASDQSTLTGWLELAVARKVSVQDLVEPAGSMHPELQELIGTHLLPHSQKAPRDYDRFVSLLKFYEGDAHGACGYAKSYLQTCKLLNGVFAQEPGRTLRQLREMKCSAHET
jgi:hypothetical protein